MNGWTSAILVILTVIRFTTFAVAEELDGTVPTRCLHFSILPGFPPGQKDSIDTTLSLNVLLGVTQGINGLQLGTGIGVVRRSSRGAQFSLLGNIGEESFSGIQLGGIFSALKGSIAGVQASPVLGYTGDHVFGMQLNGLVNWSGGDVLGLQAAGVLNTAIDVYGLQAGLVNIADDVRGVQIGLVNIADSMDGIPLGIFNLVGNGYSGISLWYDSESRIWTGIQSGARHAYSILYGGMELPVSGNAGSVTAGFGMGIHGSLGLLFIDSDISMKVRFSDGWETSPARTGGYFTVFPSLRVVAGGEKDRLGIFGGIMLDMLSGRHTAAGTAVQWDLFGGSFTIFPKCFIGIRL